MSAAQMKNPAGGPGFSGVNSGEIRQPHVNPLEVVVQRLEARREGKGYRSLCPCCGGKSRKVAIAEGDEGRVLIHAFCGCSAVDVLGAVGLALADLYPARHWPASPEERRRARRAIRETGWASALAVLSLESKVALVAARQLAAWGFLSVEDDDRLAVAVERIECAANVLVERRP
jgi:hypothetical protein